MIDMMTAVTETQMVIPTHEMAVLLAIITLCLLFRANKTGLFAAYLFVYRWGWLFFRSSFADSQMGYFITYMVLGVVAFALAAIRMRPQRGD